MPHSYLNNIKGDRFIEGMLSVCLSKDAEIKTRIREKEEEIMYADFDGRGANSDMKSTMKLLKKWKSIIDST